MNMIYSTPERFYNGLLKRLKKFGRVIYGTDLYDEVVLDVDGKSYQETLFIGIKNGGLCRTENMFSMPCDNVFRCYPDLVNYNMNSLSSISVVPVKFDTKSFEAFEHAIEMYSTLKAIAAFPMTPLKPFSAEEVATNKGLRKMIDIAFQSIQLIQMANGLNANTKFLSIHYIEDIFMNLLRKSDDGRLLRCEVVICPPYNDCKRWRMDFGFPNSRGYIGRGSMVVSANLILNKVRGATFYSIEPGDGLGRLTSPRKGVSIFMLANIIAMMVNSQATGKAIIRSNLTK